MEVVGRSSVAAVGTTLDGLRKLKRNLGHLQTNEQIAGATGMGLIWLGALFHGRKAGFVKSTISSGLITLVWVVVFTVAVEMVASSRITVGLLRALQQDRHLLEELVIGVFSIVLVIVSLVKMLLRVSLIGLALQMAALFIVSALILAAKMYELRLDDIRRRGIQDVGGTQGQEGYYAAVQALQHRDLTPEDYTILQALDEFVVRPNLASPPEVIKALPTHVLTTRELKKPMQCCVCLFDLAEGDTVKIIPCFHQGHNACVDAWLTIKGVCPICNITVSADEEDFDSVESE
uniref:RING-type domain-containing protein n=1 Tax=Aplanochytrium stocchinoi TaxID=215587 RepID=A0A7S3LS78_9STRA|mmetsp:Transcript_9969/g.11456  ORF Transcript_9969/g.11456 Transcript_9969/m.11456 type:complete len:291 (+) Transcript_9969:430-1302(+)|eukprot:CAMPEP_0204831278 /NCGR_PEP_ID=MMETSP1346-20131115/10291_1 /ASSEMBLY_ACC=CAM_ASM_000771 /TAXON_ID=215587 /ORGANISM="Aplanochytrium stocchinoi, Strain GSBS06" /LENGTH=290 /DNA_ID=CAMNT_0051962191 /DNA_START=331 /DNA_END=1203 /DNA_ORIENTATION=-